MNKFCVGCKIIFITDDKRRKFCSYTCYNKNHEAWNKGLSCIFDTRLRYNRPTVFKKGGPGFPYKHTEESKRKMSESHKGQISWMKGKIHTEESKNKNRLKHLGKKQSIETIQKRRQQLLGRKVIWGNKISIALKGKKRPEWSGEKHPSFNNWSSREPYGKDFSPELKEKIRQRDKFRCQQCFRHQNELFTKNMNGQIVQRKLLIHHIDYDKKNNNPENLISLCTTCHSQTNFNRTDWASYFQNKIIRGD